MALTTKLNDQPSPIQKDLEHVFKSITNGAAAALISGVTGKRIRIWRFNTVAVTKDKSCELFSGANAFPLVISSESRLCHHFQSSGGIPVYTCNDGEDFNADPSDSTNWHFYIVYSIE